MEKQENEFIEESAKEEGAEQTEELKEEQESQEQESGNALAELEAKLKEYEDKYIRTHADFENTKRRLEREKYQTLEYAYEKFAKDLLPVIDSLEGALKSSQNEDADAKELLEKVVEGVNLTIDNLYKAFNKHGIEVIDTNEGFNPHLHEAVMQVESQEHDEGEVVAELQRGYKYKERVIRPAMVSIAKK